MKFKLDYLPPTWTPYIQDIVKMRDVWNELRLCDKREYLQQKAGESDEFYKIRLKSAVFQDRVRRAIQEFAGVLALNSQIRDETPFEIQNQLDDVDGLGSNFPVWLNRACQQLLRDGCTAWFVAWDETVAQWKLVYVDPLSIKAPIIVDNKLIALTIESSEQVVSGYSTESIRVFYRHEMVAPEGQDLIYYQYTKYIEEKSPNALRFTQVGPPIVPQDATGAALSEIPLIWLSLGTDKTPLSFEFSHFSTLADLTIQQFNKVSELNTAESSCNIQTLTRYWPGAAPDNPPNIYTGANAIIEVTDAQFGGKIEFLEPTGEAIQITHQRNQDRESYMDALARQFVTGDTVQKTATQVQVEISAVQAQLLNLIASIQDAIEGTFRLIMTYAKPTPSDDIGGILIDSEAIRPAIDVPTLKYWQELADLGYIERDKFLELLQVAGTFPRGFRL